MANMRDKLCVVSFKITFGGLPFTRTIVCWLMFMKNIFVNVYCFVALYVYIYVCMYVCTYTYWQCLRWFLILPKGLS